MNLNSLSSDFTCMLHIILMFMITTMIVAHLQMAQWYFQPLQTLMQNQVQRCEPSQSPFHIPSFDLIIFNYVFSYHIALKLSCVIYSAIAFGGQQILLSVSCRYLPLWEISPRRRHKPWISVHLNIKITESWNWW